MTEKARELGNFKEQEGSRINSFHFSWDGLTLISSSEDDQILIYDVEKGTQKRRVNSQKYGVDLIHFTHASNAALHASTKRDDAIRYLSLHDNKFIRYFAGHSKRVTSLDLSPEDDTFISGSMDHTVRLWDLRAATCQGVMNVTGKPVVAFDPEGLVFSVGCTIRAKKQCEWTSLRFSPHGKYILLSTNGRVLRLLDAFNGTPLQTLSGHMNNKVDQRMVEFMFGKADDGNKVCVLNGGHVGPVQCVEFNPSFMMMASACTHLNMWLPNVPQDVVAPS
ncbi:WDR82 [Lepeophtheirus salmonis]|uniref:WDR82 n=1 Tax=Lepeophtheirus salmonis TaxID=72036 RepID=A0A7R8CRU7_LEPSM|nr:WDR82 [Lepeophtheirus salmonis]CAF2859521.1 WDR82 [Lepeophtheirus salmonis]